QSPPLTVPSSHPQSSARARLLDVKTAALVDTEADSPDSTHVEIPGYRKIVYTLTHLVIRTQNWRGLKTPEKRSHLLRNLKQQHVSVAHLQETYLRPETNKLLRDNSYQTNVYSNHPSAHKAGTAILLASHLQFTLMDKMEDTGGRFLFIKGEIARKIYTFATVYAPNSGQASFLRRTIARLSRFTEGALLFGGDLNVPLEPRKDTQTPQT
ncbi:Hypothetical predicted protein, partial [Pelobates cultripes]